MGRIRTIKPEFPQSESMGRISREARLLFILLWTICDDSGRTRGASRMLASLLFPYDDDAPGMMNLWLRELEQEGCIVRYEVDGLTYIQTVKWALHQKIDKPSKSKFPPPPEGSLLPREASRSLGVGSRTKDQGRDQGEDQGEDHGPPPPPAAAATQLTGWTGTELTPQARSHFEAFRRAHRRPLAFAEMVRAMGPGGTRQKADTWEQLSQALVAYAASNFEGPPGEPILLRFLANPNGRSSGPEDEIARELRKLEAST